MNTNRNHHNSQAGVAKTDYDGFGNRTAVETSTTLRRPNSTGDEKIPTGSPPYNGRREKWST